MGPIDGPTGEWMSGYGCKADLLDPITKETFLQALCHFTSTVLHAKEFLALPVYRGTGVTQQRGSREDAPQPNDYQSN